MLALLLIASLGGTMIGGAQKNDSLKPIEDYPLADKIWLSVEDGQIKAADQKIYRSQSEGYITFLKQNGAKLAEDELWAIVDQDHLTLEQRALELEKTKLTRSLKDLEREQKLQIEKQKSAIEKLLTQKTEILLTLETNEISPKLKQRIQSAITELDQEIQEIQKTITPEIMAEELEVAREELNLSLDRKIRGFQKLQRRSRLKADFAGTLNLLIDEPNSPEILNRPQWIDLGSAFASIINEEQYEIRLGNRNPIFNSYPREQLIALLDDGRSRTLVRTNFAETRKIELNGVLRDQHIFKFPDEHAEYASQNIGETRTLFIYLLLEKQAHIIKKKDIALSAPEVLETKGWAGLISHLFPGYELLHNGPKTLAVVKKDGD